MRWDCGWCSIYGLKMMAGGVMPNKRVKQNDGGKGFYEALVVQHLRR